MWIEKDMNHTISTIFVDFEIPITIIASETIRSVGRAAPVSSYRT